MKAQDLTSIKHNIFFLETLRWACACSESSCGVTPGVPVSHCLSLCFVPPQSLSASPKQRKQSVFTPPALKGTVRSCPAPGVAPLVGGQQDQSAGSAHEWHSCHRAVPSHHCLRTVQSLPGMDHLPDLAAVANRFV